MIQCFFFIMADVFLLFVYGSPRNVVRSRRNPKDAGDLSSRHELLTEIDPNLHPSKLILTCGV